MQAKVSNFQSKWASLEFIIYYCIIILGFYQGFKSAYRFSLEDNPNYNLYSHGLGKGWIGGRRIDTSDHQWRSFRNSLPLASFFFGIYLIISKIVKSNEHRQEWNLQQKLKSKMAIGIVGLFLFHGLNTLKILFIFAINYQIGKITAGKRFGPLITWIYALGTLFLLEFASIKGGEGGTITGHPIISQMNSLFETFPGMIHRWTVTFNISILRLISFNLDYHYAKRNEYSVIKHYESCQECSLADNSGIICEKRRVQDPPSLETFNFTVYLAYLVYLPLYFAGPIITFNNFISQISNPIPKSTKSVFIYGVRWLGSLLLLEIGLHYFYIVAIKDNRAWLNFSPTDFIVLACLNLKVVWLKLLVIWRFFRFIALVDGIVTTENMTRCMSNTYSGLAFWRSWHRSFNKWIIRYMYIPLGGTRLSAWNIWPIFTFVAVWHDIRLNLLIWSWLICFFILPEIVLKWLGRRFAWEQSLGSHYRHLESAAAGGNIFLMGVANLVGFVVGLDGIKVILASLFGLRGLIFTIFFTITLFAIGNIQLEIRSTEKAKGIIRNY